MHQYEPLPTPSKWGDEERRLIRRLTEILDDVYSWRNRLRYEDIGGAFKSRLADASNLTTGTLDGSVVTVTGLNADYINAGTIDADQINVINLNADNIVTGSITASQANIDFLAVKDMTAGTAIIDVVAGDKLYIGRLVVNDANLGTATVGQLMVRDAEGKLWKVTVDPDTGAVTATEVTVDGDNLSNNAMMQISQRLIFRGPAQPSAPFIGMMWMDTSVNPSGEAREILKRCTAITPVVTWETVKSNETHTAVIDVDDEGMLVLSTGTLDLLSGSTLTIKQLGDSLNVIVMDSFGLALKSTGKIDIESNANLNIKSGGDIEVEGGADINVASTGKINVASGGDIEVNSGADININSGGNLNVISGGDLHVASGGDLDIDSAGNLNVNSGGSLTITAPTTLAITAGTTDATSIAIRNTDNQFLSAGDSTFADAKFSVTMEGALKATNATITGAINATSGSFTGAVNASSGTIGAGANKWTISADATNAAIHTASKTSLADNDAGVYIGVDGMAMGTNSPFKVTSAGALTATDATITGAVTATSGSFTGSLTSTSGTVGGFTLKDGALHTVNKTTITDNDAGVYLGTDGIAVGGNGTTTPFKVDSAGALTATNATITGAVTATSGSFTGAVTATSGSFTGSLTSTSGTVGGFTLKDGALHTANKTAITDNDAGVYLGTDGIALGGDGTTTPFKVTSAGELTATNADITGKVTTSNIAATGGTIGGFTISSGKLTSTSGLELNPDATLPYVSIGNIAMYTTEKGGAIYNRYGSGASIFEVYSYNSPVELRGGDGLAWGGSVVCGRYGGVKVVNISDDLYVQNNCSALSFTDRTPAYIGDAISELMGVRNDKKGNIDHSTLPMAARKRVMCSRKNDDGAVENHEEDGRDIGMMVSILTKAVQQLTDIVEKQQKQIDQLLGVRA